MGVSVAGAAEPLFQFYLVAVPCSVRFVTVTKSDHRRL